MEVEYLLIGQGIAGSVLACKLLERGKSFLVIDDPELSNASRVAGGLYNPITGRKMVKTWQADALFKALIPFYQQQEEVLKASFFHEMPIYRPFFNQHEQNEWMGNSAEPAFQHFIKAVHQKPYLPEWVQNPFGGLMLNQSGYLDTKTFVAKLRQVLLEEGKYKAERFDVSQLVNQEKFVYGEVKAQKVIFCEGRLTSENPFFKALPFSPVKGEVLFIRANVEIKEIINRGVFMIPLGDGLFKVGSTYEHKNLDESPTPKGEEELIERLMKLIHFDFDVVDQKAGVRPATKDRKPFMGEHPMVKGMFIFNGLGTKGVSLAPLLAEEFLNFAEEIGDLNPEVNISRFFSLF